MRLPLCALILISSLVSEAQSVCDCDSTFTFIYSKWGAVNNMSYHSNKNERKMDVYERAEFDFVVQRKPFKVAGVMTEKRHRLLYDSELNPMEALYIPSGFPYTNLWLDVHGKVFRGLNHYTISNAGCEFIFGIIRDQYRKIPEDFVCKKVTRNGKPEIEISAQTKSFTFSSYMAKPGETALSIADKFKVMAYVLIEYNDGVDNYTDDLEGTKLKIPSHYGSKVKLVVSAVHGMPTIIHVEDPKGLLEHYDYTNYKFNLTLPENYFTESYLDDLD
ncbi:MAG: LysM peptidoglycan-binding domain-containing protein [Flavobacteriales bacterium]|jgi:LysM repeat protein|nr:LysM peptidoglycan-binding domain-containing protein [Flavobacteriales bacterium]